MFRIKICGVTEVSDAIDVADAGADAVGLNFYASSPRCVSVAHAAEIAAVLPAGVCKVGVFVNCPVDEITQCFDDLGLDVIQLHGDEPPDAVAALAPRPVIRAFRCRDHDFGPLLGYCASCGVKGHLPIAVLVDAYEPGSYGGTGNAVDWTQVPKLRQALPDVPIILAGGLRPANVAEAIRTARPDAVDTASGVEASPGGKDPTLVRQFVQYAATAYAGIDRL